MELRQARFLPRFGVWLSFFFLLGDLSGVPALAQGLRITDIRREGAGTVVVEHPARATAYYLLFRGTSLTDINHVVAAKLGVTGNGSVSDTGALATTGFYRLEEVPLDAPLDTDGDLIDDAYELATPGLDPLNPGDAGLPAPGAGGQTYLEAYREQKKPLATLASTSPFTGEDGVAVTRETIFRLTRPLAADAVLSRTNVHASFGGRLILSRVDVSADRRSVTLFPLENLPASARVRVTFDPGETRDDLGRRLDLAGTGRAGSPANVDFDTLSITPVGETAVIGHVFASERVPDGKGGFTNRPLANVTITVDGAEETLRTTTNPDGSFQLKPTPAGRFFVHVDGRTSTTGISNGNLLWSHRDYYPLVGKAWEAVAGIQTNLANSSGIIYLPLVPADALQPVSSVNVTVIPFPASVVAAHPEFAGVEVRVPANSLYDNSGLRGGRIGLAPVASDRLPEPLPAGLEHVLDITIQSDGPQNFDQPVPVRFPNLPSPTTGERLPPGAQTALVSFNHRLGRWEVVGSMTVSADGKFLDSDPGVGIRQPGWHGWQRLTWPFPWPPIVFPPAPEFPNFPPFPPFPPPGPFPPPFPQPPKPAPPVPIPGNPWETGSAGMAADDGPNPPPTGPYNSPNPFPNPDPNADPNADPDSGPGGGPGGPNGGDDGAGVSAGAFCLDAAIEVGCVNTGAVLPGAPTVAISPSGKSTYNLAFSQVNGAVTAEVRSVASGQLVFATQVNANRPPNSVGFGPAEQAFVHVFRQTTANGLSGDEVVELVTLNGNTQSYAASRTVTLGASFLNASSVRFSPHGRYLTYTALKTDAQIALVVVDVLTREVVFNGSFPYSTAPVLVQPADMIQFGPDCADRTMIFQFGDTPTSLAWHLINLETRQDVARRPAAPGSFSSWGFSSCGDAVQLNAGPAVPIEFFATRDGRVITGLDKAPDTIGLNRTRPARPQALVGTNAPLPAKFSRGLHYWLLVDMLTGDVVQRGRSGGSGALMEGVMLAPNRPFRLFALRAADLWVGRADFVSGNVGAGFRAPSPRLEPDSTPDGDGDGLGNLAEYIVGSNRAQVDSNGDGLNDGAAVRAGLDPLEGGPLATGIVAAVPLPGAAVDVCAVGDRVIVALGSAGVAVLQHPPGRNPTVIALVDTPGDARRVSCSGNFVAVADGPAGLQIVNITDPPAARISAFLPSVGVANCVAAIDGTAYVGTQAGQVVLVNLATGTEIGRISVGAPIQDLQFGGDRLYVLSERRLLPYRIDTGELLPSGPGVTSGSGAAATRLFVGLGLAYVTHSNGFRVFDLSDPDNPVERTTGNDTQAGWAQLVANGSGLGLAGSGPAPFNNNEVQVYNLSDPSKNDDFLTRYVLPANVAGVTIHHGVGYVAATGAGLQVLNYLAADTGTNPPAIHLSATFPLLPAQVESGRFVAVQAVATDDVQVRQVEFYLDGVRVSEDGNFPFEYGFFAPTLTTDRTEFRLRAKAVDTAGNFAWSEESVVKLLPDQTPPRVRLAAPAVNGFAVSPTQVGLIFNEPVDAATVTPQRLLLTFLGPDRVPGSPDDVAVLGTVVYNAASRVAELVFPPLTTAGRYQVTLIHGVTDLTGNPIAGDQAWAFDVVTGTDSDGDGLTDAFELANGLDPHNADQNNNGIPDALEDFDGDGLTNGQEMLLGTNPLQQRTFNGILDSQLDRDGDFLPDIRELELGTDPLRADTDGDGWNDEIEVSTGSDPLRPNAYLNGTQYAFNHGDALRLDGVQFQSAQADMLRLGDGQVTQATALANVLRLGGPDENGYSVIAANPAVRVRIFDVKAADLAPNELPRAGAFVIEAEDYDFGGGQSLPIADVMPYFGGAYSNLVGVLNVDYFNTDGAGSQLYRPLPAPNSLTLAANITGRYGLERAGWSLTRNFRITGAAGGDWQQYTRVVPSGDYWVWAALSHDGTSPGQLHATLDLVVGDHTQPQPALASLGTFDAPGTGAYGNNSLVLLRDVLGEPVVVSIQDPSTSFRVNLGSGDFDWFVLVPTSSAPQ